MEEQVDGNRLGARIALAVLATLAAIAFGLSASLLYDSLKECFGADLSAAVQACFSQPTPWLIQKYYGAAGLALLGAVFSFLLVRPARQAFASRSKIFEQAKAPLTLPTSGAPSVMT